MQAPKPRSSASEASNDRTAQASVCCFKEELKTGAIQAQFEMGGCPVGWYIVLLHEAGQLGRECLTCFRRLFPCHDTIEDSAPTLQGLVVLQVNRPQGVKCAQGTRVVAATPDDILARPTLALLTKPPLRSEQVV
eukprot:1270149-Amphidinium_carterae.1